MSEHKRVLITGATGFIGRHVVADLLHQNFEVIALVRDLERAYQIPNMNQISWIQFDIELDDVDDLTNLDFPENMIHLAWDGLPNYKESFHLEKNLPSHKRFLANVIRKGVQNLFVSGTCFEYGLQEGGLSPQTPAMPVTSYATAKNELRLYLEGLQKERNFQLKWGRIFYIYGEGQSPKSLPALLKTCAESGQKVFDMSEGNQLRDYSTVESVAQQIVQMLMIKKQHLIANISSGQAIAIKDFVRARLLELNCKVELNLGAYSYNDYEPMAYWGLKHGN